MTSGVRFEGQLTCLVPEKIKIAVIKLAAEQNVTQSDVVRNLLSEAIKGKGQA
jgi:hypothetical protein